MNWDDLARTAHRRFNPLLREWVLVSPGRTGRPWQGRTTEPPQKSVPSHDPQCYLCPGNDRAGGRKNPAYDSTFVFENDFPAMRPDTPNGGFAEGNVLRAQTAPGICRVVCFSPRHDLSIPQMAQAELRNVVNVWIEQDRELSSLGSVRHVQIFENRGDLMGASNPHPHCQIWADSGMPNLPAREIAAQAEHFMSHGECLLCSYLGIEEKLGDRIVCSNDRFVALVPFWAVWPFEILVLGRRHFSSMQQLEDAERDALGDILRQVTRRYDNLFGVPFPYSMGFHQAPVDGQPHPESHFHAHYFPPLLRSAMVQKFMVGYELLAMPQRDITPEDAAMRLRAANSSV